MVHELVVVQPAPRGDSINVASSRRKSEPGEKKQSATFTGVGPLAECAGEIGGCSIHPSCKRGSNTVHVQFNEYTCHRHIEKSDIFSSINQCLYSVTDCYNWKIYKIYLIPGLDSNLG